MKTIAAALVLIFAALMAYVAWMVLIVQAALILWPALAWYLWIVLLLISIIVAGIAAYIGNN